METPSPSSFTLKDLAREVGVSVATVDRVLHGRAGVREDTARKVREAIERHDFRPSPAAADLARGRQSRFAFVMPEGANLFMLSIRERLGEMSGWLAARRVGLDTILTDVFNPATLIKTLESLNGRYDGVAVVALDHPGVRAAIDDLVDSGVFVVTLVSDVPGSKRRHYVGVDNVAAGRTAASLVGRLLGPRSGKVAVIAGSLSLRDHSERVFGFNQVLTLEYPKLQALPPVEGGDQDEANARQTAKLLAAHPDIVAVYNVGAGTPGVAKALAEQKGERSVFVAHDLTPFTRRYLQKGLMDALIVQDPGHEARSAVRVLLALVRDERILAAQEKINIDIVMRDNLP